MREHAALGRKASRRRTDSLLAGFQGALGCKAAFNQHGEEERHTFVVDVVYRWYRDLDGGGWPIIATALRVQRVLLEPGVRFALLRVSLRWIAEKGVRVRPARGARLASPRRCVPSRRGPGRGAARRSGHEGCPVPRTLAPGRGPRAVAGTLLSLSLSLAHALQHNVSIISHGGGFKPSNPFFAQS